MFTLEEYEKQLLTYYNARGMDEQCILYFRTMVYDFYALHKRDFPWRTTPDPYGVFVSEVMLQQTQTARVITKFEEFITLFPDFHSLAAAPVPLLLKAWQGLGYNRRALNLQKAAAEVVQRFGGILPSNEKDLLSLPGVGAYTAAAVQAFAYNQPALVIDTNIRAIFIYFFFKDAHDISDARLLPLVKMTLDEDNSARWYSALMDFGVFLKSRTANPARKSKHYAKQTRFEGSLRQIRGKIIALLCAESMLNLGTIYEKIDIPGQERIDRVINALIKERFIICDNNVLSLYNKGNEESAV